MTPGLRRVLFALFFASGFCGLLYQVVWMRLALASFGVNTPVLSVVISVFMLGLFVGSWGAGKFVAAAGRRSGVSPIWWYAVAELLIGLGAYAVPRLFTLGESLLLQAGHSDSAGYLVKSAGLIAAALLPWCVCMGTTYPFMMGFVKERDRAETTSFSYLYMANVVGAMAGTLVTAIVLVELLGFRGTLGVAAILNLSVAAAALSIGLQLRSRPEGGDIREAVSGVVMRIDPVRRRLALVVLFTTGFTSMAMEVTWIRGFTPVLKTQVYSFASLLFTYLLATWLGSSLYRRHLTRQVRPIPTSRLISLLGITAFLPLILGDPLLGLGPVGVLGSIVPFCGLLGYLTPKVIDRYSAGTPERAGFAYAINILGCILGPLVASYFLMATVGLKATLVILALPYAGLYLVYHRSAGLQGSRAGGAGILVALLIAVAVSDTYEDRTRLFVGPTEVRRDHTATVISYGEGMNKRLLVNGIGMTHLTTITKMMAHLPLAMLPHRPQSALVICFGMGTTWRSLLSWEIKATAVELVPSVVAAFPYYFDDAHELLGQPNGQIVIDDGRRFLRRTKEQFDVITLDPPPPVEAAGSSLLYSEEFYKLAKSRLKPGGILQQWIPVAESTILIAVVSSLKRSFAHVRMFGSVEGWGYHVLAADHEIPVFDTASVSARMPERARSDLLEWEQESDAPKLWSTVYTLEVDPSQFVRQDAGITDDRPFNEYYVLRRAAVGFGPEGERR